MTARIAVFPGDKVITCDGVWVVTDGAILGAHGSVMCRSDAGPLFVGLLPCDFMPAANGIAAARVSR